MKLRNKKTGGIVEIYVMKDQLKFKRLDDKTKDMSFNSLAELNEDWEDYEEPKSGIKDVWFPDVIEGRNNVVISFETKEEAKKAVEKLKAWKRLKDVGCRFILDDDFVVRFVGPESKKIVSAEECMMLCDDYRMLFGGEE